MYAILSENIDEFPQYQGAYRLQPIYSEKMVDDHDFYNLWDIYTNHLESYGYSPKIHVVDALYEKYIMYDPEEG